MLDEMIACVPSVVYPSHCGFFREYAMGLEKDDVVLKVRDEAIESNPQYLQLVTYVALINVRNRQIINYARKGSESRLHGKRSIGIGGHVQAGDLSDDLGFAYQLEQAARRETEEELGKDFSHVPFQFMGYLQDQINPVGQVHLGVCYLVNVADLEVCTSLDGDTPGDGELLDVRATDIEKVMKDFEDYERWSQMYLGAIARELRIQF